MRILFLTTVVLLTIPELRAQPRGATPPAAWQLERAMSQLSAADDSIAAIQHMLETDAAVLAKLREAREMLEEETQPMTAVNAAAVRIREASQLRPHRLVEHELIPVISMLKDFQQSSANIDLPRLTRQLDVATNTASDVVVEDVRIMQPVLGSLMKMQAALQARLSGLIQAQGRAMEMRAKRSTRR